MSASSALPRGALKAAWDAMDGVQDDARTRAVVRAAIEGALPVIQRAAVKEAARQILLLDGLARHLLCPACHGKPSKHSYDHRTGNSTYQCGCGHSWERGRFASPNYRLTAETIVARLARGEALPDLPPKETPDA